jgi:hypothetical protein
LFDYLLRGGFFSLAQDVTEGYQERDTVAKGMTHTHTHTHTHTQTHTQDSQREIERESEGGRRERNFRENNQRINHSPALPLTDTYITTTIDEYDNNDNTTT